MYTTANLTRQKIQDAMTKALYAKTSDTQEGVLFVLLDEMTDQHVKQALLAYVTLLKSGARTVAAVEGAPCSGPDAKRGCCGAKSNPWPSHHPGHTPSKTLTDVTLHPSINA